jgi:glycosyltransferase involved in cell wall biosynthesis
MKKVWIEMERLRDLNSGLGQFCFGLGKAISEKVSGINLIYYLPKNQMGIFGHNVGYAPTSKFDKITGIGHADTDICHCLHQESAYLPKNKKTKIILTIHDLNFLHKYKSSFRKNLKISQLQKKVNKASALTFISKYTETECRKHLTIPNIPTRVIYNGINVFESSSTQKNELPEGKYLFSTGIIQPKKNFHVLISLLKPDNELKLVIAGRKDEDYAAYMTQLATAAGVSDRLIFTGTVSESHKHQLYQNCYAFVFPSLSEGFGLPVIEAMWYGKPVFISRLTSLPEVGGQEAYYFDDFSEMAMNKVFFEGMQDYNNDTEKAERIMDWAKKFSWEIAAESYLNLYQELLL